MSELQDMAEAVAAREAADRLRQPRTILEPWMAGSLAALEKRGVVECLMAGGVSFRALIEEGRFR